MYYITRVLDTDTKVIEERIGNDNKYTNASIDIFPIDGTPNNPLLRKIYFFRVLYHRALMSLCYKDSIDRKRKRSKKEKLLLWVMEKVPVEKLTTPYKQKCKIDKLLRKQPVKGAKYIGNIMGAYRTREIVPAEYYGEGAMYPFEDIQLRGLSMYDEYLTYTYGDYMQLPPEESRKTHFKILEIHGTKVAEE
jgi:lipopolysaccharide cholinephosphotransferase